MIKAAALIALILFTSAGSWQLMPSSPESAGRIDDIQFATPVSGWAVTAMGTIYHTNDAGQSWKQQHQAPAYLRSVELIDEQLGFAGSLAPGIFLRTQDGGETWKNIASAVPEHFGVCGLAHVGVSEVHAVGRYNGPAKYHRSADSGLTWETKDLKAMATGLVDVVFLAPKTGFIAGMDEKEGGVILRTDDGGNSWQVAHQTGRPREYVWKLFFATPFVGYASVYSYDKDSVVLKTVDGGRSWQRIIVVQDKNIHVEAIGFSDEKTGWVGGYSRGVYETTNGGESWVFRDSEIENLNRIFFLNPLTGFASGSKLYKFVPGAVSGGSDPVPKDGTTHAKIHGLELFRENGRILLRLELAWRTHVIAELLDESRANRIRLLHNGEAAKGKLVFQIAHHLQKDRHYFVLVRTPEHFLWVEIDQPTIESWSASLTDF